MMVIDDVLLAKLQKLAMIEITPDKAPKIEQNLSDILKFIDNLSSIDTDSISLASELKTPMRADVVLDSDVSKAVLDSAPNAKDNFFIVPKIIE